jgi:hypothetical protein
MRPLIITLIAGSVAACAPALQVGHNTAPDLQPQAYRTYSWDMPDQFPTGDPRLDNNPFFVKTLQDEVEAQLRKIGLNRVERGGDLSVHFHATVRDRVNVYEVDRAAGYDQTAYGKGTQVQQYEEGTILVDIAEAAAKKLIWRGWMQSDLSGVIGDNAELGKRVREGMTKLFATFPAGTILKAGG